MKANINKRLDDINQFKRDLKSYKNYKKTIDYYEKKLLELDELMMSNGGISFYSIKAKGYKTSYKVEDLIDKKQRISGKINTLNSIVKYTENKLDTLTKEEKDILLLAYCERCPIFKIANVYYTSESAMKRRINRIIYKLVEEDV